MPWGHKGAYRLVWPEQDKDTPPICMAAEGGLHYGKAEPYAHPTTGKQICPVCHPATRETEHLNALL